MDNRLWYFDYTILYYEEFYEDDRIVGGIIAAYDIKDAFNRLMCYYGDNITNIHIYSRNVDTVLELTDRNVENNTVLN